MSTSSRTAPLHSRVSRRTVLKGAATAGAVGAVCPFSGATAAAAETISTAPAGATAHTRMQRGLDIAAKVGRSAEGRYGLMFKTLPAYTAPDDMLVALADSMMDPRSPQPDPDSHDAWDNFNIGGGYTFFGQFIDHDITRDTTPLAQAKADPRGTKNYDTPFLDLGSVYGRGPLKDPQLYEADGKHLKIDRSSGIPDLPRDAQGTAYLGDPRNDENIIIAQLHVAFLGFHNNLIDSGMTFARAKQVMTWEYQRLVVSEFLTRIVGPEVVDSMLVKKGARHVGVRSRYYKPRYPLKPYMPVEFSAGAYRFGHSMIRPEYEMNDAHTRPIFSRDGNDLRGSRPVPVELHADWSYFFDIPGVPLPNGHNFSRVMDTKLAAGLHTLPATVQQDGVENLAARNLLRGARVGTPAGQDVATAMGVTPLSNAELGLTDPEWGDKAPLWFYILKEAEVLRGGSRLGPVGGRLVAETILGLLANDPKSYLYVTGGYVPKYPTLGAFLVAAGTGRHMGEVEDAPVVPAPVVPAPV